MYLLAMKISEYINYSSNKAEARRDLAKSIGVSEVSVRSWANGSRHPSRKLWPSIVNASGGAITIFDLSITE